MLWQLGAPDHNNTEFALAPKGYDQFKDDGFFVVGRSDPKQDWPYVHPGPTDGWAGGRPHTFTILFGLKNPPSGESRLILDLLDTHSGSPPRLRLTVNGRAFTKNMPKGAGDASVHGEPAKGRPSTWEIPLPADLLRAGDNTIELTTQSGSWILYDCVRLETPAGAELAPVAPGTQLLGVRAPSVWLKDREQAFQPVTVTLRHVGEEAETIFRLAGAEAARIRLKNGTHSIDLKAAAAEQTRTVPLSVVVGGQDQASTNVTLTPPRIREMWLLPHSHVDIGYTHRQEDVVKVQIGNLEKAMELSRASATNPPGMRFKWNPEAVWSLDHFLQRATSEKRQAFIDAVRRGDVEVDALYGNMLTALCRPEELAQCLSFGARLSNLTGRPVTAASICDVPGYTWGIVPIMAQAGVKYFAIGPNGGDRVGTIHQWDDKPFYWKSQSGRERLLCWVVDNYHHLGDLEQNVLAQIDRLGRKNFPYDTAFIFWVGRWPDGGVDNAPPDEQTAQKVLAWNAKYAAPRIVIGLAGEFFSEFEKRHGKEVPEFSGDLTPYWEDGAGSTSRETALNRATGDRLAQAAALFAMRDPKTYPGSKFDAAWKNALLYSEHTWGAWCSISKPDDAFTLDQWRVKQSFALDADKQSRELLAAALPAPATQEGAIDVFNTTQWPRTDLAVVPAELTGSAGIPAGSAISVADEHGKPVLSQRLASGELVFLAKDIPPFGAKRYRLSTSACTITGHLRATGTTLENGKLRVELDPVSGEIKSLRLAGLDHEFVNPAAKEGFNGYRYVLGTDAAGAKTNGPVRISVADNGPLVATIRIESSAPGCRKLVRQVRLIEGLDRVELVDEVDRESVREKDAVHFGFGFNVPHGQIHMETPWGVVRPNVDQLPGSCRNWFTVQRWVDISSPERGITWAPLDAPLVEIGGLTANLLGSVRVHEWMTNANDSQTLASWAQNNHWHTNYKIDQPGVTTFRFMLRPHKRGYSPAESTRFGLETTRPLLVAAAEKSKPAVASLLTVSSPDVLVETIKGSDDGQALIVRLFGISDKAKSVNLRWHTVKPANIWLTDLTERPLQKAAGSIAIPAYGVVSLRAEFK